jgi:predicted N-formylglutamate amidohydrolase
MKCIISCEHASNKVPRQYIHVFAGKEKVLASHQAYDPGAAAIARRLAGRVQASVYLGSVTRLLIDLNRSPANRKTLYTPYSRKLQHGDRKLLFSKYYRPYREIVEREINRFTAKVTPVLHISVHSFSPVKGGRVRKVDIGLLYDPARRNEKMICAYLASLLQEEKGILRVRRNYPYQGKTDGFTSFMRKKLPVKLYAGIEIEINQTLLSPGNKKKRKMEQLLEEGIKNILKQPDFSGLVKIL